MGAIGLGMIMDFFIGDPRKWPHPVVAIGKLIQVLENILYPRKNKKVAGGMLVFLVLFVVSVIIIGLQFLFSVNDYLLLGLNVYLVFAGIAYRSLMRASKEVSAEVSKDDIESARSKVSMYVSRDTKDLTMKQVVKTVIETVAENSVDGILAPMFYCILGQLLLGNGMLFLWLYKGINTMDSMIAYKNDKYMDFGFVAAKVDDLVNFVPARLGALLLLVSGTLLGYNSNNGRKILKRDCHNSASPNAGYPESVIAGLIETQIGGTYNYFGKAVEKATIGDMVEEATNEHIIRTERVVGVAHGLVFILVVALAFLLR